MRAVCSFSCTERETASRAREPIGGGDACDGTSNERREGERRARLGVRGVD